MQVCEFILAPRPRESQSPFLSLSLLLLRKSRNKHSDLDWSMQPDQVVNGEFRVWGCSLVAMGRFDDHHVGQRHTSERNCGLRYSHFQVALGRQVCLLMSWSVAFSFLLGGFFFFFFKYFWARHPFLLLSASNMDRSLCPGSTSLCNMYPPILHANLHGVGYPPSRILTRAAVEMGHLLLSGDAMEWIPQTSIRRAVEPLENASSGDLPGLAG